MSSEHKLSPYDVLDIYEAIAYANSIGHKFNLYIELNWPVRTAKTVESEAKAEEKLEEMFRCFTKSVLSDLRKLPNFLDIYTFARVPQKGFCTLLFISCDDPNYVAKRIKSCAKDKGRGYSYELRELKIVKTIDWQWKYFKKLIAGHECNGYVIRDTDGYQIQFDGVFGKPKKYGGFVKMKRVYGICRKLLKKHRDGFVSDFYKMLLADMEKGDLFSGGCFYQTMQQKQYDDNFNVMEFLEYMAQGDE